MPPDRPRTPARRPRRPAGWRVPAAAWWAGVAAVAGLFVASFEAGHAVGTRLAARRAARAAEPGTQPAVPTARAPMLPPPPARPTTKAPPPPATPPPPQPAPSRPAVVPPLPPSVPPPPAEPAAAEVRFETAVRAVFQAKCNSCHGTLSKRGGLDLRTLATTVRGGNSGPGVVPGRPGESPVWETVRTGQMPPPNKPQLTAAEKDLIRTWIAGGARP